jgi:hypothetical protein
MRKLESWFNPQATKAEEDYNHGREMTLDQVKGKEFLIDGNFNTCKNVII